MTSQTSLPRLFFFIVPAHWAGTIGGNVLTSFPLGKFD